MKPIRFEGHNVVFGEGQPQYNDLPAFRNDSAAAEVISCWELTDEDLEEIIRTKKIWTMQMTFNRPFQPMIISATPLVQVKKEIKDEDLMDALFGENGEVQHSTGGYTCDPKKWEEIAKQAKEKVLQHTVTEDDETGAVKSIKVTKA